MKPACQLIDVDSLSREISAAAREVFAGHDWHVGAIGPTADDPRWTVVVRSATLTTPLFVVRERTFVDGLCGITACVLEAATERRRDAGRAVDALVSTVNALANEGVLS